MTDTTTTTTTAVTSQENPVTTITKGFQVLADHIKQNREAIVQIKGSLKAAATLPSANNPSATAEGAAAAAASLLIDPKRVYRVPPDLALKLGDEVVIPINKIGFIQGTNFFLPYYDDSKEEKSLEQKLKEYRFKKVADHPATKEIFWLTERMMTGSIFGLNFIIDTDGLAENMERWIENRDEHFDYRIKLVLPKADGDYTDLVNDYNRFLRQEREQNPSWYEGEDAVAELKNEDFQRLAAETVLIDESGENGQYFETSATEWMELNTQIIYLYANRSVKNNTVTLELSLDINEIMEKLNFKVLVAGQQEVYGYDYDTYVQIINNKLTYKIEE